MQHIPKSLVMTPQFEAKLAAVNGIVIASKIAQGGQLYKKKPWTRRSGREPKTVMICSICSSACRDRRELRGHFVSCVGRNGNPNGARWDDCLTLDDESISTPDPTYAASRGAVAAAAVSSEGTPVLEGKNRNDEDRLAACNGITIQSKLPAGQRPSQGIKKGNERKGHPCIICDRKFVRKHHVRAHFPTCVERNGNPAGARWDDAWTSPAGHVGTQSSVSQNFQMEDLGPEDYELDDVESNGPGMDDTLSDYDPQLASVSPDGLQPYHPDHQQVDLKLASPSPNSVQPSDRQSTSSSPSGVQPYDPQPTPSSPNGMNPYNPHFRMDVLTNEALLSMFHAWQDAIHYGEGRYTVEHPHFQEMMKELVKRDMMSVSWKWTVDIEKVDMAWTRAMVENPRV